MKRIDVFGVAAPLLLLAACATSEPASAPQPPQVETTFTPFHELPGGTAGRSFFVQPAEAQASCLAWATYANQVALGLEDHGLRHVQSATGADYAVSFSYGMGTGSYGMGTGWAATVVGGRAAAPSGNGSRTSVYTIGDQTFTTVTALPPASAQAASRGR